MTARTNRKFPPESHGVFEHIPAWFAAIFGAVYISGYMINFLFYSRMGIQETGTDAFKLQYVYTGLLFFLLSLIFAIPLYFFALSGRRVADDLHKNSPDTFARVAMLGALMSFAYLQSVVFLTLFSGPGDFREPGVQISAPILLAAPIGYAFGVLVLEGLEKRLQRGVNEEQVRKIEKYFKWIWIVLILFIIGVIVACDVSIDTRTHIIRNIYHYVIKNRIFLFYIVLGIATFTLWHCFKRSRAKPVSIGLLSYWADAIMFILVMYFLAILFFANDIYPIIPKDKGGGDFTASGTYTIDMHEFNDQKFVLIYRSEFSAYFARIDIGNGPNEWRFHDRYPHIVMLPLRELALVSYEPPAVQPPAVKASNPPQIPADQNRTSRFN